MNLNRLDFKKFHETHKNNNILRRNPTSRIPFMHGNLLRFNRRERSSLLLKARVRAS